MPGAEKAAGCPQPSVTSRGAAEGSLNTVTRRMEGTSLLKGKGEHHALPQEAGAGGEESGIWRMLRRLRPEGHAGDSPLPWPRVTFKTALARVAAEAGSLRQSAGEGWFPPGEKRVLREAAPKPTGLRALGGGPAGEWTSCSCTRTRAPPGPALLPGGEKQPQEAARGSGLCVQHCGTLISPRTHDPGAARAHGGHP